VSELAPRLEELDRLNVRTVLVGSGPPTSIDDFIERLLLVGKPVTVVTDPTLSSFRAAGLVRSWWATMGPRALWDFLRATGKGHVNRSTDGDSRQQGGTLLVDTQGRLVWYHRNESLGDYAPATEIVDAVLRLVLKESPALI